MLNTQNKLPRLPRTAPIVIIPGVVWWCGGVVWCGVVVWFFLPILIPPQQNCFKLFWVVGWVVATPAHLNMIITITMCVFHIHGYTYSVLLSFMLHWGPTFNTANKYENNVYVIRFSKFPIVPDFLWS